MSKWTSHIYLFNIQHAVLNLCEVNKTWIKSTLVKWCRLFLLFWLSEYSCTSFIYQGLKRSHRQHHTASITEACVCPSSAPHLLLVIRPPTELHPVLALSEPDPTRPVGSHRGIQSSNAAWMTSESRGLPYTRLHPFIFIALSCPPRFIRMPSTLSDSLPFALINTHQCGRMEVMRDWADSADVRPDCVCMLRDCAALGLGVDHPEGRKNAFVSNILCSFAWTLYVSNPQYCNQQRNWMKWTSAGTITQT